MQNTVPAAQVHAHAAFNTWFPGQFATHVPLQSCDPVEHSQAQSAALRICPPVQLLTHDPLHTENPEAHPQVPLAGSQ
ncbi:MAG: hypothetical protein PVSMB7_17340 [Chloroflexota bacterium]